MLRGRMFCQSKEVYGSLHGCRIGIIAAVDKGVAGQTDKIVTPSHRRSLGHACGDLLPGRQSHLKDLKTRDGILKAKSEIFDYMAKDGEICLNAEDDKLSALACTDAGLAL